MKIPKLGILDFYIIKKFLGTFFFAILLLISVVIVFDISEKIDDFLNNQAPLKAIIFQYYLNFIPYFLNLFSPLFTFIALIFFTAKMASNTEFVAILGGGISFRRIILPYMISAGIIASISYALGNWVIPPANKVRLQFEEAYIRVAYHFEGRDVHRKIAPGEYAYVHSFTNTDNIAHLFSYERFNGRKLVFKLTSDYAQWDTATKVWHVHSYFIRQNNGMREVVKTGALKDTTFPGFTVAEFSTRLSTIESMNTKQLSAFIEQEKQKGSENINTYLVEKYRRVAFPCATFVLTLIGVSLASRKIRGGIGMQLGLGIGLSFTYILFMQVSTTFSIKAGFSPFIAVWIPNIIFSFIALYLYRKAPK